MTLREDKYEINSPYTGHFSIVATVKDTEHLKALNPFMIHSKEFTLTWLTLTQIKKLSVHIV